MIPGVVAQDGGGADPWTEQAGYPASIVGNGSGYLQVARAVTTTDSQYISIYAKYSSTIANPNDVGITQSSSSGWYMTLEGTASDNTKKGTPTIRLENSSGNHFTVKFEGVQTNNGAVWESLFTYNTVGAINWHWVMIDHTNQIIYDSAVTPGDFNVTNSAISVGQSIDFTKANYASMGGTGGVGAYNWGEMYRIFVSNQDAGDLSVQANRDTMRTFVTPLFGGRVIDTFGSVGAWNGGVNYGSEANFTKNGSAWSAGTGTPLYNMQLEGQAYSDAASTTVSITLDPAKASRNIIIIGVAECTALPTFTTIDGTTITNNVNTATNGGADGFYDATAGKAIWFGRVTGFTGTGNVDIVFSGGGTVTRTAFFVFDYSSFQFPSQGPNIYLYPDPGPQLTEAGYWHYQWQNTSSIFVAMGEGPTAGAGFNANVETVVVPPTVIGGSTYVMVGQEDWFAAAAWKSPQPAYDVNGTNLTKDIGVSFTMST